MADTSTEPTPAALEPLAPRPRMAAWAGCSVMAGGTLPAAWVFGVGLGQLGLYWGAVALVLAVALRRVDRAADDRLARVLCWWGVTFALAIAFWCCLVVWFFLTFEGLDLCPADWDYSRNEDCF